MCLISICPKGTEKDTSTVENFIKKGAKMNIDGSGYMFKKHGEHEIYINKGFFNVDKLLDSISTHSLKKEDELIIHHRTKTLGAVNPYNCHPFIVSPNKEEICTIIGKTNRPVLAHNGWFREMLVLEARNNGYSDTYSFCKEILGKQQMLDLFLNDTKEFEYLFKGILNGAKLALLLPNRDYMKIGNWEEEDGYLHSNSGYKTYIKDVGGSSSNPNPKLLGGGNSSGENNITIQTPLMISYEPIIEEDGGSYTPLHRLTGNDIMINKRNFDHFYFVKKNDKKHERVYYMKHFTPWSNFDLNNQLYYVGKNGKMSETVNKVKLQTEFYFYVKVEYNSVYGHYRYLQSKLNTPKPGKKTLKKLAKPMNHVSITSIRDTIYLKRVDKEIIKLAVYLYYDYWKDEFDAPSLEHVFKDHDLAQKIKKVNEKFTDQINHSCCVMGEEYETLVPQD